jgi:hypothetical protein
MSTFSTLSNSPTKEIFPTITENDNEATIGIIDEPQKTEDHAEDGEIIKKSSGIGSRFRRFFHRGKSKNSQKY